MGPATTAPSRSVGGRTPPSADAADLDLLTGPLAGEFLAAAVGAVGGTVRSWRARQVRAHGAQGSTASYHVSVGWADGRVTDEILAACTGSSPDGTVVLDDGRDRVAVWRFPFDPDLPGLAEAHDEHRVAALLADLGLGAGAVRLRVRAYRPRRRAVIEAVGPRGRLFIKAVRPDRAEALHERHRLLRAAGVPAPPGLGWTTGGLVVLQALPGPTLRRVLRSRASPVPTGGEIIDLLDRLPAELAVGPRRRSWLDRVGDYAAVVATVLPAEADAVSELATAISAEAGAGPTVPVHGDFYENQLLVDGGRVCGLLDLDTAGPGDRLDDLACLVGHLSVLAQIDTRRAPAINRLGARYLAAFERIVDPADLRYRTAAVVISLAPGPHRVQERHWPTATRRRVELAGRWLASARLARA